MTKKITNDDLITLEYTGKLENGMIFSSSNDDGNMKFQVGKYEVIKGLNTAVLGMGINESKHVTLNPEEAFGLRQKDLIIDVSLSDLPENLSLGMQLKSEDSEGQEIVYTVKEIKKNENIAFLDGNHMLAGQKLEFDIKVLEIE